MKYLNPENILQIHLEVIEATGGLDGLRDLGLLESATARPQASFAGKDLYLNIFLKSASLAHSLILNHPFVDGNKRTAVSAVIVFLEQNRKELEATQEEFVNFALWIEGERPEIKKIATWIRQHSRPLK
ncbi:MAG: type II toxin-antitoxin system death-on-curing family toxin [Patescibacteria group bacterium]